MTKLDTPIETPRDPYVDSGRERHLSNYIGSTIFFSRWLQAPLYIGLIAAQALYVVQFWAELWHLFMEFVHHGQLSEEAMMLTVLGLVDVIMIANLLIMVIVGGYETFVSRIQMDGHPDQPEWLSHVNPNVLKVKLAMSIIGISSIHLLTTFLQAKKLDNDVMMWQTIIHMAFIASAIGLALIDKLQTPPVKH